MAKNQIVSKYHAVLMEGEGDSIKNLAENAVQGEISLQGAVLRLRDLSDAKLCRTDKSGKPIGKPTLLDFANLTGSDLSGADLRGASLCDANLSTVIIDSIPRSTRLIATNLSRADLSGAKMHCANLAGSILTHSVLVESDLSGAILLNADCTGAKFSGAKVRGVNLLWSQLDGADFSDCEMVGYELLLAEKSGSKIPDKTLIKFDLSQEVIAELKEVIDGIDQQTFLADPVGTLSTIDVLQNLHPLDRDEFTYELDLIIRKPSE